MRVRAAAVAGPAIMRAGVTAPTLLDMVMGPITVMWAPTINLTSRNITGPTLTLVTGPTLTLVTGRMLTQAAGTFAGIIAGIIAGIAAGCIAANTVAIIAAASVLVDRHRGASFLGEMKRGQRNADPFNSFAPVTG